MCEAIRVSPPIGRYFQSWMQYRLRDGNGGQDMLSMLRPLQLWQNPLFQTAGLGIMFAAPHPWHVFINCALTSLRSPI